jgi:molybdopterin-containing oxidoreductase family membrane subunit
MKARLWIGLLCTGVLIGLATVFRVYTAGFQVYAKTDILVWTMPVATYIFLSLISSGLAFCCSIPVVFNIKRYEIIEKRTVFLEISVLLGAFVCLALHLGSPLHVVYLILSPNLASPLWWLATLYGIYLLVLLASFWKIHSGKPSKPLCAMAFFIAIGTATILGWLVGMTDARPTLNPNFFSVFFPLSAFACGLSAILVFSLLTAHFSGKQVSEERMAVFNDIAKLFGVMAGVTLLLTLWRTVVGVTSSSSLEFAALKHMVKSVSYNIELWLGLVVPIVLMLIPSVRKSTAGKVTAAVLFLVGMFFGRLEVILSGLIMPLGAMAEGRADFVSYLPTIWEVFVALFGISVVLLVYTLGDRYLQLDAVHE